MDRTIPYDKDAICDGCGHKGAYDFMGDYLCDKCAKKVMYTDCECSEDCDCKNEKMCEWCGRYPVYNNGDYCAECEFGPTDDNQAELEYNTDDVEDDSNIDHTDDLNE